MKDGKPGINIMIQIDKSENSEGCEGCEGYREGIANFAINYRVQNSLSSDFQG